MFIYSRNPLLINFKRICGMTERNLLTNIDSFSKQELANQITRLETHVKQLQNIIKKQQKNEKHRKQEGCRKFDFSKYKKRHIALKILYFGWDYHGFASQEDTANTIEAALFNALLQAKLIESRETSNYSKCGRTDKGVSALSQVISLDVRSNLLEGEGIIDDGCVASEQKGDGKREEFKYQEILNRLLPPEIKVLSWAPVSPDFSARFNCMRRTYKYFFPRGNLDIEAMSKASKYLLGVHDFRNFCKMNVQSGVVEFTRSIAYVDLSPATDISIGTDADNQYDMFQLTISGKAFLWHQVRYIVAILFHVGDGSERPEIVKELLDIETNAVRPQYNLAKELPLVLYDCDFDDVKWRNELQATEMLYKDMQRQWSEYVIKSTMLVAALKNVEKLAKAKDITSPFHQTYCLTHFSSCRKKYKPLMSRPTCDSLETKISVVAKRQKIQEHTVPDDSNK